MNIKTYEPHRSSIGNIDANFMAVGVYILPIIASWVPIVCIFSWLIPLAIALCESKSDFVKFVGLQAFIAYLAVAVIGLVGHSLHISLISGIVTLAINILSFIAFLMAFSYKQLEIPVIADIAKRFM